MEAAACRVGAQDPRRTTPLVYTRRDVSTLTRSDRRRFVNALLELKRRGEYDEFVRLHIEYYVPDGETGLRAAHMAPSFLPWHRKFLLDLEGACAASTTR